MRLNILHNIYIDITLNKFSFIPRFKTNNPNRFTSDEAVVEFSWFGILFRYTQMYYNDLIHIHINENEEGHKKQIFIAIMQSMLNNDKCLFWSNNTGFVFNYCNHQYYITGYRRWFLTHNLGSMLQRTYPELYMSEDEMKLFPTIEHLECLTNK